MQGIALGEYLPTFVPCGERTEYVDMCEHHAACSEYIHIDVQWY